MKASPSARKRNLPKTSSPAGERSLIAAIRARTARPKGALRLGIGDDCAILRPSAGEEIVITTDFSLDRVHFRRDWHSPEVIGHRCLARGLSDLAAMGARPVAAFLSLAIPAALARPGTGANPKSWTHRFLDGLLALADRYQLPLAGGDTAQSSELDGHGRKHSALVVADIVLVGAVKRGHAFLRSGARAGDVIYSTGELGGAAAELLAIERKPKSFAKFVRAEEGHPHLFPHPRIEVAQKLASSKKRIHSAIDLSDGLSTDLHHLCEESDLSAELDAAAIPIHPLALKAEQEGFTPSALALALHGGEDYELLFTAPKWTPVPRKIAGINIHPIGQMQPRRPRQPRIVLHERDGHSTALEAGGWEHFS